MQKTIAKNVSYTGIGLHSGKPVTMTFKPLSIDSGIVFKRIDLPGEPVIEAKTQKVTSTVRSTTLTEGDANVFTIEHVMAALFIADIDNCMIELNEPEPPVADGSAAEFLSLLSSAGIVEQKKEKNIKILDKSFSVYDEDKYILALPYEGQRFSFLSINDHPLLGTQYFNIENKQNLLEKEIAPARTVAFMQEIDMLKKMGLGLGGNKENVIVYDKEIVLTPLRFHDELVRHKILDILGDFFLLGRFNAHIIACKSGHTLNYELSLKLLEYMYEGARK